MSPMNSLNNVQNPISTRVSNTHQSNWVFGLPASQWRRLKWCLKTKRVWAI